MSACVLSYNKVTNEVTITAEAAQLFQTFLQERRDEFEDKVREIRFYLADKPREPIAVLALETNMQLIRRFDAMLSELKEVTVHVKDQEESES